MQTIVTIVYVVMVITPNVGNLLVNKQLTLNSVKKSKKFPNRLRIAAGSALLVALACIAMGLSMAQDARDIQNNEQQAMNLFRRIDTHRENNSSGEIAQQIAQAREYSEHAYSTSHSWRWNIAARIPVIGSDISTVQGMTAVANSIVSQSLPKLLNAFTQLRSSHMSRGDRNLNLEPILQAQDSITQAEAEIQAQIAKYNALPQCHITQVVNAYNEGKVALNKVSGELENVSGVLKLLPDFFGSDKTTTYAILAMTTSEARSAGGLVGSVGTLKTDNSNIAVGDFRENADFLPYGSGSPSPSESQLFTAWGPLQMSLDIRDLAVYPDTSRTAEQMREIWRRSPWNNGHDLDGVILVDPLLLQELIGVSGKITLSDGRMLTSENTAEFLLNTVYKDIPVAQQNAYFSEVAKQAISGMFENIDFNKLARIAKLLHEMAQSRHFAMYSFDATVQKVLDRAGFTAHMPNSETNPSVGVYVTEQNASKMDWYIHRSAVIQQTSCGISGSQTYHVIYSMHNTLSPEQVGLLPPYIVGVRQANQPQGYGIEKTLIFAPKGGRISQLQTSGDVSAPQQTTLDNTALIASVARIAPAETVTYSFDVSTSDSARTPLHVDQTPLGWLDSPTLLNSSSCNAKP